MLQSVTGYLKKRQKGFAVLATFAGGAWLLTSYARQRFKDLSERMVLDSNAKENMRRRFRQNQEDCTFVLLAQLPTLSRQLFSELDVEALTAELQRRAEVAKRGKQPATGIDSSTASLDASSYLENGPDGMNTSADTTSKTEAAVDAAEVPLPLDGNPAESIQEGAEEDPEPADTRTKAELWQAIKVQTFHRTVTALYLICLLDLLTHVQLNLLGRYNYVSSIYEQALPEPDAQANGLNGHSGSEKYDTNSGDRSAPSSGKKLDSLSERQYLSFGWWFLQRGWRQVSRLVSQVVDESLGPVSLKAQFGLQDFNKLLLEIRRKVEYEPTGAVHSFSSALFPSIPEDEQQSLSESGLPHSVVAAGISPQLRDLLNETQDFLDSPDFSIVLRSCLDKTFELLSSSLSHLFVNMPTVASGRFEEVSEKKVRLAAILPALARAGHSILQDTPNEYADALASNRELQEFSAVVFSHFVLD